MRTNAILLIDLENFFLGREENINSTPAPHTYSFKEDLERLYNFAVDLAGSGGWWCGGPTPTSTSGG